MTRQTKSSIYKHHRSTLRRPKTDGFYTWPEISRDERVMDNFLERLAKSEAREAAAIKKLRRFIVLELQGGHSADSAIVID